MRAQDFAPARHKSAVFWVGLVVKWLFVGRGGAPDTKKNAQDGVPWRNGNLAHRLKAPSLCRQTGLQLSISEADVEAISGRLRRVAALSRLPASVLHQLASSGLYEDLEKGVTLFKEGDGGHFWYTVLSGTLTVSIGKLGDNQSVIGLLSTGDTFGDCLLENREATVRTKTTCELFRVNNHDVQLLWEKNKDSMTELFGNSKLKNGYGNKGADRNLHHPSSSNKNKSAMAEPPNPAAPILESASSQMLHVGWVLRTLLAARDNVLQERKYQGHIFRRCASGSELVDWLLKHTHGCTRPQAAAMFQALLEEGVIAHVKREVEFRDASLLYQFCADMEGAPPLMSPTSADFPEAEMCLSDCLSLLNKRAPDAILRLILRKPSNSRTPEELCMIYEELIHISALSHLSDSVKRELASIIMFEAHTRVGTVLFEQGDEGQCWYIILRGSVDVVIHGKGAVAILQEGDDFGKLALVNASPRAATIILRENNCHFLRVDKQNFNRILRDVEANTVRLQEHGEDVLVLEKLGQGGKFTYGVMAGTAEKVLEHILETRLDGQSVGVGGRGSVPGSGGSGSDHLLDDFLLTYPAFISTDYLVQLLTRHYHVATPSQDRDFLILSKKRVVRFAHRWVITVRQTVFDNADARKFFENLTTDVENEVTLFPSLAEEASLVHHLATRLARHKEATANRKDVKWKLPPTGQPVTLFSGPSSPHRIPMKPIDDIIFRVYCADHTYCTLRVTLESTATDIKMAAADRLKLKGDDLTLAEVKSNGERVPIGDDEPNVATALSLNGRLFVAPRDHIDALTIVPEQEQATEATDYDIELFSTKELAYHLTLFDWDLFWCVHEHELLFHVLGKHRFGGLTANIEVFLRRFHEIQYWVATEILSTTGLGKRVTLLKKMIKLASYCKDYQNLNGFLAIVLGLSNAAVSRLSLTWEKLPGKFRKMFTEFELLTDPLRNYRAYRVAVGKLQPPVLPFVLLLIKDMGLVHESHKTFDEGLVNFEKMHMLAASLRTLRHARTRHLVLEPPSPKSEAAVRTYVSCLRAIDNQKQLTSMSHKLEPRRS